MKLQDLEVIVTALFSPAPKVGTTKVVEASSNAAGAIVMLTALAIAVAPDTIAVVYVAAPVIDVVNL